MRQISYPNGSPPTTHLLFGMIRRLAAWRPKHVLRAMLPIAFAALLSAPCVHAGIVVTGDVDPSDPKDWVISDIITDTTVYIGDTSYGSVIVDGSTVSLYQTYLGHETGSAGTLTLQGVGTTWTTYSAQIVGYQGTGTLKITNGASMSSPLGYIGRSSDGSGTVIVDGVGSSWTMPSGSFYAGEWGTGTLKITNGASVSNTAGFTGTNAGASGTVIVDGVGSSWTNSKHVCIGVGGTGTLNITNGASVSNTTGYIGRDSGSSGTAIVDGVGSSWTNSSTLRVGNNGTGTLKITNGASVSNTDGYTGRYLGSGGTVIVDGVGSTWTNSGKLYVGLGLDDVAGGTGTVSISDGGAVSASAVSIGGSSILTTDLGYGSSLTVGSGSGDVTNNGTLRLVAGAGAASGIYTPMSYGTLSGNDAQALGGVWDSVNHTVTVSKAVTGLSGDEITIDLASRQRMLFVDPATARVAGASFQATTESTDLTLTADLMDASLLSALEGLLGSGEEILTGWNFTAGDGYNAGDPAYLSLEIGSGYDLAALAIWHYDDSGWTEYATSDLAYDNVYASFTVTGFSGYAVTGTSSVPIPAAFWLLGSGIAALVGIRRRNT